MWLVSIGLYIPELYLRAKDYGLLYDYKNGSNPKNTSIEMASLNIAS